MSTVQLLLVVAIVVYIIAKRFAGSPVGSKTLVLPLVMSGYGLLQLDGHGHHAIGTLGIALLAIEAAISVAAGAARAATIKLYVRDGHLWQRYTIVTLGVWVAVVAVRLAFVAAGNGLGANLPETGTMLFTFGLSMVFESLFVSKRAASTGAPIMPRQSRQTRRQRVRVR